MRIDAIKAARTNRSSSTPAEEIEQDEEFYPYFKVKTVLLEDGGDLTIGSFECVAPSLLH